MIEKYYTNSDGKVFVNPIKIDGLTEISKSDFNEIVNPTPTPDQNKERYKKDLASKRWEVATGGVIIDGVDIQSDDKSKDEMAGYVTESIVNGLVNVNWKLADGTFKVYTVQEFKKVYQFVAKYRNDCFGVESSKLDEINATGTTDLETGWPDNNFAIV